MRPARVGDVGDVRAAVAAAGQVPDHPGIDVAEHRFAARAASRTPSTLSRIHWIFAPEEICRGRQARPLDRIARGRVRIERAIDDAVGARVLPDDGVVPRAPGLGIPDHRGFALVGDADGGEIRAVSLPALRAPAIDSLTRATICSGSCSTQPGFGRI